MKYKLETIPVWDAFDADSECPFCLLEQKAEQSYLKFFLGNSVMVPEMRVEVNSIGFCRTHFPMLFNSRTSRHALSLLTHTHLMETDKRTKKLLKGLLNRPSKKSLLAAADSLKQETKNCMICTRIEETLKRYLFTALYLWKRDEEGFRDRFAGSQGFCLYHLRGLIAMAPEALGAKELASWLQVLCTLQEHNGQRLEEELFFYSQKFDFQNDDKPWGTAKDALERGIQKLTGRPVKDP